MAFSLDAVATVAPELETPTTVPAQEEARKPKAPLVDINPEVFRKESHLLQFKGYIANNFKLEDKADGTTGETKTVMKEDATTGEVVPKEVKVTNFEKRPQAVGFAVENTGAEGVMYFVDKFINAGGKKSLITEGRFDELEVRELAVGETAYLTKYALGLLAGDQRFGSLIGAGVMKADLANLAKEVGAEFDADNALLTVNLRQAKGATEGSLDKSNIYLSVNNTGKVGESAARVTLPISRYPIHIVDLVGTSEDGFPALEGATVKPEFAESFGALATKGQRAGGGRKKSGSAEISASARKLAKLAELYGPKSAK